MGRLVHFLVCCTLLLQTSPVWCSNVAGESTSDAAFAVEEAKADLTATDAIALEETSGAMGDALAVVNSVVEDSVVSSAVEDTEALAKSDLLNTESVRKKRSSSKKVKKQKKEKNGRKKKKKLKRISKKKQKKRQKSDNVDDKELDIFRENCQSALNFIRTVAQTGCDTGTANAVRKIMKKEKSDQTLLTSILSSSTMDGNKSIDKATEGTTETDYLLPPRFALEHSNSDVRLHAIEKLMEENKV